MEIHFLGLDIDIPDDPVGFIKTKAIELLNYLGYSWPSVNEDILDQWAEQWRTLPAQVDACISEHARAINHVLNNNTGPATEAFCTYMRSDRANIHTLQTISNNAGVAAAAYSGAALIVRGLRAYVIGKLTLDAIMLAAAILTGGLSSAGSMLARKGISAAINIAIDQAINHLLGA